MAKKSSNNRKGNGFDAHPENINRAGAPDKAFWWRNLLIEAAQKKQDGIEKKVKMADALVDKAVSGDIPALKEFADRVQGRSPIALGTYDEDGSFKQQNIGVVFIENDKD